MTEHARSPQFSIITAARDASDTVARSIASVRAQTAGDWELVVADDGSVDATAQVALTAAENDPRIRVVSGPGEGAALARNRGVERSTGEWLVFLDADDQLEPGYLQRVASAIAQDRALDVVGANGVTRYPGGFERPTFPDGEVTVTLAAHIRTSQLTVTSAVRRAVFEAAGGFRDTYAEDYDLWLRLLAAGAHTVRLGDRLVRYDAARPDAKSRTRLPELDSVIESLEGVRATLSEADRRSADLRVAELRAEAALVPVKAAIRQRRYRGARAAFWRHRAAMRGMRRVVVLALVTLSPRLYRALAVRVDPSEG